VNISSIGGQNPFTTNIKTVRGNNLITERLTTAKKSNQIIAKEEVKDNLFVDTKRLRENEYASYIKEYSDGITMGKGLFGGFEGNSLEDMYKYSLAQFDKINSSSENDEIKDMRRTALESVLKQTVDMFSYMETRKHFKLAPPSHIEKDKEIMAEMREYKRNQDRAVTNSVRKLTLNFLDYVKNANNFSVEAMLIHINKGSSNNRDANNLSLSEVNGFFDYANNSGHMYSQSKDDEFFFKGYFKTAGIDADDTITTNRWGSTVFNPVTHQEFASVPFRA